MTELLFNTLANLSMIAGIIFMLFILIYIVRIMYECIKDWIDDWREEHE